MSADGAQVVRFYLFFPFSTQTVAIEFKGVLVPVTITYIKQTDFNTNNGFHKANDIPSNSSSLTWCVG